MASSPDRFLRWTLRNAQTPPRTLTEEEFIREVLSLAQRLALSSALEPMLVEGLEAGGSQVQWRAYLEHPRDLFGLAHQLASERCLRAEASADATPTAPSTR